MLISTIIWFQALQRRHKQFVQAGFDTTCAVLALWLVELVSRSTLLPSITIPAPIGWAMYVVGVIAAARALGLYRTVVRYMGIRPVGKIFASALAGAALLWTVSSLVGDAPSSRVMLLVATTTAGFMLAGRVLAQELFALAAPHSVPAVVIYGAGEAGRQLLLSLMQSASHRVVALVDDNPAQQGAELYGVRVYGPEQLEMLQHNYAVQEVILAMPTISREQKQRVLARLEQLGLPVKTMPRISDILAGTLSVSDIREIAIEDVLSRDPVAPDVQLMQHTVANRCVMVTGGGGSIGSELCLQIAMLGPTRLVVVESSEYALYTICTALHDNERLSHIPVVPVLLSVTQEGDLQSVMRQHGVHTVFHAAAYKHVPLVEANPFSGLHNNVFGTLAALNAAEQAGVRDFVLISSDKAVRPTNIMGASKRLAELICQARHASGGIHGQRPVTRVSMVRFGNVLSSSGSVIPRFEQQIRNGGPVTVTHPDITRYFMTISEAVQLVLQASGLARGGEVFLLDMGEPVRITDLAYRMIRLSGLTPVRVGGSDANSNGADARDGRRIPVVFTGLRPGEKLYEELLIDASAQGTEHPKIFRANEPFVAATALNEALQTLRAAIESRDLRAVHGVFATLGIAYSAPTGALPDLPPDELTLMAHETVPDLPLPHAHAAA